MVTTVPALPYYTIYILRLKCTIKSYINFFTKDALDNLEFLIKKL